VNAGPVEPGEVERYHQAALELADEARRIVTAAVTRAFPNHRVYRAAYAHTAVVSGAADAMVDMHNEVWDLAPARVLIEEAGGRYALVRDFPAAGGGRLVSAVFGRPSVVGRLLALFGER
jgi:fructose-1,6-bisphosphatase/inositol monophosphatase family enzyme